jgi:periplasmic divalent cation tolerance protein
MTVVRRPRVAVSGLQVLVAVPSPAVATRLGTALLERHLCACVQTLGPIRSRYRWKGKLESAREWLLLVKTRPALYPAVEHVVRQLHPYELPEIVGLPMRPALWPYLEWIAATTASAGTVAPQRRAAPTRPRRG